MSRNNTFNLRRGRKFRKADVFGSLVGLMLGGFASLSPAAAQNINTTTSWNGSDGINAWGVPDTATYGQTITATGSADVLHGFTFYLSNEGSSTPPQFQAFVYAWNSVTQSITGSALYTSAVLTAPTSSGYTAVAINTGSVSLTPGKQYVLFFTTSTQSNTGSSYYQYGLVSAGPYAGGQFVYQNNGTNVSALSSSSWNEYGFDLAFIALLSGVQAVPPGSGSNATGAQQASFQLMNSFLDLLLDPFADNRNGFLSPGGGSAIRFADEQQQRSSLPAEVASAYAMATKAPVSKAVAVRPWNIWAASYGDYGRTSGEIAGTGNQQTISRAYGFASGLDYRLATGTTVGFAVAGAHTSWGLSGDLGDGGGDAVQTGIYANHWFNRIYLSGAAAFTYYRMSTDRTAFADQLSAAFNAQSYGGRIEAGYLIPTVALDVIPYAAFQAQSFDTPSYSETSTSGSPDFALNFTSHDATAVRTELGARFDKRLLTDAGSLTLFGRLAWAHDNTDDPTLNTTLEASPATSFIVYGTPSAPDLALVSVGAGLKLLNNWSATAKIDGEFGDATEYYNGSLKVAYNW
jgi:uncharacterized protein with beta-barrel porin domain